ncbi:hypothetical protein [Cryptosporangium arvum]|nr:hypothetical protein [Cryptosporangium arvum]
MRPVRPVHPVRPGGDLAVLGTGADAPGPPAGGGVFPVLTTFTTG